MIEVTLIFPAYNEAKRIAETVSSAIMYFTQRDISYEIIVSADGTDGTREKVADLASKNPFIRVIGNPQRLGKGKAIREAVKIARGDIIGFADADEKTPISELDKFLPFLHEGWDIVIGSRGQRESIIERRQPWFRRIGSTGFAVYMHTVVGLWDTPDTQCGFKFFRADAARLLFACQIIDGYMFDVEILYLAQRLGLRIQQIPVRWRDDGDSRLDLVVGNVKNAVDIWKIRFYQYNLNGSKRG